MFILFSANCLFNIYLKKPLSIEHNTHIRSYIMHMRLNIRAYLFLQYKNN